MRPPLPRLPLVCGVLLLAPPVAHADVFVPPGEHMGPDTSHQALGPGLSLGLEKEGFRPAASLRFQAGAEKEHPYFRAALTAAPLEHRYGAELGTSLHLGGLQSPIWRRDRLTLDAVLTVEDGQLVPALAPGLSVAWLAAGGSGGGWGEVGLGLRAVLPPWHWNEVGPRLELGITVLFGLHAWPRGRAREGRPDTEECHDDADDVEVPDGRGPDAGHPGAGR